MSEYFPEPQFSEGRLKTKLDLTNYATTAELKNTTGVATSKFTTKVDLASLKSSKDKLDINALRKCTNCLNYLFEK